MDKTLRVFPKIIGLQLLLIFFFTLNGVYVAMATPSNIILQHVGLFPLVIGIYFYLLKTRKWGEYFSRRKLKPLKNTAILCSPLLVVLMIVFIGNGGIDTSLIANLLMVLLIQIFVVAFIEESFFRGFMLNILLSKGFKRAVFTTSSLFALTHSLQLLGGQSLETTIIQVTYAFFIGMVLSLLIVNNQSIILTITFHGLNNFLILMGLSNGSPIFNYLIIVILITFTVYLWIRTLKSNEIIAETVDVVAT